MIFSPENHTEDRGEKMAKKRKETKNKLEEKRKGVIINN